MRTGRVTRKEFSRVMRDIIDEKGVQVIVQLLNGKNASAKVALLRLLFEYGFGKPLDPKVHLDARGTSPEAILLELAGQPVPKELRGGFEDDDEEEA